MCNYLIKKIWFYYKLIKEFYEDKFDYANFEK